MLRKVRRIGVFIGLVLLAEVLILGSAWVWYSTHVDDPLGTSEVPNSMLWKYFEHYQKQSEKIDDLLDQLKQQQRLIENLVARQTA